MNDESAHIATQCPCNGVAGLPILVIARPDADSDRVAGATFGSRAIDDAVVTALAV